MQSHHHLLTWPGCFRQPRFFSLNRASRDCFAHLIVHAQSHAGSKVAAFHNLSNEMLADKLGHADAQLKGAEAESKALKDEFKRRGLLSVAGDEFTVTATEPISGRFDTKAVREFLGDAITVSRMRSSRPRSGSRPSAAVHVARRSRWPRRKRQVNPDRRQERRPGAVRQMVRHRGLVDGVEYLILKESDIMGVIEETFARTSARPYSQTCLRVRSPWRR
jgi:hypothetical protein